MTPMKEPPNTTLSSLAPGPIKAYELRESKAGENHKF